MRTPLLTAAATSYLANCALGVAVATRVLDTSGFRWVHHAVYVATAVLTAAGTSLDAVFKVNVFLSDMEHFTAMNEVYKTYWGAVKPARTCVAVKQLPLGTDVEIECQAVLP